MTTTLTPALVDWYERKTAFLLRKYGPGPRVHYHTGLVDPPSEPASDEAGLRAQCVASQERMLERALAAWFPDGVDGRRVLDAGCGLGGTTLWLASRGARAVGINPVPGHVALASRFALDAGLAGRASFEVADAHAFSDDGHFDHAVSFGAVNYFDRPRWFRHLRTLLRPGARVGIEDTVWVRPELAAPFDAYWLSNMGDLDGYVEAARGAGFRLSRLDDVTEEAAGFWRLGLAWTALLEREDPSPGNLADRARARAWTERFHDAHLDGGVRDVLLLFELD